MWRPIMNVAAAYESQGMTVEGFLYIQKAVQIASRISDPNHRLGTYRFVLSDLCSIHYHFAGQSEQERIKKTIISVAEEMSQLANSLDTEIAIEVRESLERKLKEAHIQR
jgi:hypothetical protein